jgi:HNH endonuclease
MTYNEVIIKKLNTRRIYVNTGYTSLCWEFNGCKNEKGYGIARFYKGGRSELVHRAYYLAYRKISNSSLFVLHKCNNPACFNPEHLYLGTNQDNMNDAVRNGTHYQTIKRFCPKGHPYDSSNTIIRKDKYGRSGRWCKICKKLRAQQDSANSVKNHSK